MIFLLYVYYNNYTCVCGKKIISIFSEKIRKLLIFKVNQEFQILLIVNILKKIKISMAISFNNLKIDFVKTRFSSP